MLGMRKKKWLRGGGAYKREMREGGERWEGKKGGRKREGEKVRRKGRQGHRETERETL